MSIVDRALNKLRSSGEVPPPLPSLPGAKPDGARRNLTAERDTVAGAMVPRRRERTIRLDREQLRLAGLLPPENTAARLTEEFRRIKWPLMTAAAPGSPSADPPPLGHNFIMVTSALPSEGKTFTAFNLALAFARELDWSVLLVDGDLARPHLSRVLGLEAFPGLTDVLTGDEIDLERAIVGTDLENFAILPAGQIRKDSPELIASRRMRELTEQLANGSANRIVVFDSPPLLLTNEAQVLAAHVGHVLVVVRANETPQPAVKEALSLISDHGSISLVLNQVVPGFFGEGYGYGEYGNQNKTELGVA
jgi:protein-tyrosine kinase